MNTETLQQDAMAYRSELFSHTGYIITPVEAELLVGAAKTSPYSLKGIVMAGVQLVPGIAALLWNMPDMLQLAVECGAWAVMVAFIIMVKRHLQLEIQLTRITTGPRRSEIREAVIRLHRQYHSPARSTYRKDSTS